MASQVAPLIRSKVALAAFDRLLSTVIVMRAGMVTIMGMVVVMRTGMVVVIQIGRGSV